MLNFEALSLPLLGTIFLCGAVVVWFAGTKLARYGSLIAERTHLGGAVVGVILLGFVTSLPEVATSVTASAGGNARLAVNNLLGGVAFQVLVLAIADAFIGKNAVTALIPQPKVMLLAVVSVMMLAVAVMGAVVGDTALGPIGIFPLLIVFVYVGGVWASKGEGAETGWVAAEKRGDPARTPSRDIANGRLALFTLAAALAILAAGFVLTRSAEGIAAHTGLDSGIVGLTGLAIATSLPEISTATAAVRLRQAEMAIGDVLGGNMFDTALILLVDVVYIGGPVLNQVDATAATAALLGLLMTCLFIVGMIERKDRTVWKMGYDSLAVLVTYVAGMALILFGGNG
jgi:cation:H+ antiporter